MKKIIILGLLLCVITTYAQVNKPIGVNISSVSDYSTELIFTDAFKQCRKWISSNADATGPWDTGVDIPLNDKGFPLKIPYEDGIHEPQIVKTLMLWEIGDAIPQGMYRLIVSGQGKINLRFGASGIYDCPVDTYVNVTGEVILEVLESDENNPINDIKFIYPEYANSFQTQTFTDEFISFLEDFQVIRFMDFTRTNNSDIVSWSDRTTPDYYSQAKSGGAAWEYVIELANLTHKDIWINIPHKADDNYIEQLAVLLRNHLNSDCKIYIEYSNEVWNGIFSQHSDCAEFAQDLGYSGEPWERAWKYTAKRSADIFKIFEDVFASNQQFIKIIPAFSANSWITNQLVTFFNDPIYNPHQVTANAIAIAPYFGHNVANDIVENNQVNTITIPEIIAQLQSSLPESFQQMIDQRTIADNHNLQLICYEGGQHLVATGENVNNTALTEKLIATNHDPGMQSLYCEYFNYWYENIGNVFCHYSSHDTYSKYGSWGIKEDFEDINNPKYLALKSCVFNSNGTSDIVIKDHVISVHPNPADNFLMVNHKGNLMTAFKYNLMDSAGKSVMKGQSLFGHKIDLRNLSKGGYILHISFNREIYSKKIVLN